MLSGYLSPISRIVEMRNSKEVGDTTKPGSSLAEALAINVWLFNRQKNIDTKLRIAEEYTGSEDSEELPVVKAVVGNLLIQPIYPRPLVDMLFDKGFSKNLHKKAPVSLANLTMKEFKTLYSQFRDVVSYIQDFIRKKGAIPKIDKMEQIKALWEVGQVNSFLHQLDAVMTVGALIDFFEGEYSIPIQDTMLVKDFFDNLKNVITSSGGNFKKKYSAPIKIGLLCSSVFALGLLFVDWDKN